jgi:hypothetical protein
VPKKLIAPPARVRSKNRARYLTVAETAGVHVTVTATDEDVRQVILAPIRPAVGRVATAGPGVSSSARRSSAGSVTACGSPRFANGSGGRAS